MSHPNSGLDDFLCFAVYSVGHAFNRVYKPLLDALGLTYPQYLVMAVLWAEDGRTVGEIGQHLFLESSTLTPILKRLEAAGYLARARDAADERVVRLRLTDEGRALRERAREVPACMLEATGRTAAEARRLKADLEAVRDTLLNAAR